MNNRDDKNAKLLAETFHDDWSVGPAAGFARAAAAHARRRRNVRRTVSTLTAASALVAIALLTREQIPAHSETAVHATPPVPARAYEIMSDDELLALVRKQSLLSVTRPDGTREIVVLPTEEKPASLE
jgi:hypothetical protein